MGLVTLIFELLALKLVCESRLRWGTFFLNLGTLGLWVLELFAMYATDGQTNGRTNGRSKATLIAPLPYVRAARAKQQQENKKMMPSDMEYR